MILFDISGYEVASSALEQLLLMLYMLQTEHAYITNELVFKAENFIVF